MVDKPKTVEIVKSAGKYGSPLLQVRYKGQIWKVLHARRSDPQGQGVPWLVLTQGPRLSRAYAKPDEVEPVFD